jgi:hypothetical protein
MTGGSSGGYHAVLHAVAVLILVVAPIVGVPEDQVGAAVAGEGGRYPRVLQDGQHVLDDADGAVPVVHAAAVEQGGCGHMVLDIFLHRLAYDVFDTPEALASEAFGVFVTGYPAHGARNSLYSLGDGALVVVGV